MAANRRSGRSEIAAHRLRIVELLRRYASVHYRYGRAFADWMGVHSTDADALLAISEADLRGAPLTPARLADHLNLTTGATATLLNRLERAGHVLRSREHTDRRIVTLRTGAHVTRQAEVFFAPLARALDAMLASHSSDDLTDFETMIDELTATLAEGLRQRHGATFVRPNPKRSGQ
jgi:DNA-binding MarR family transcriptional regulator